MSFKIPGDGSLFGPVPKQPLQLGWSPGAPHGAPVQARRFYGIARFILRRALWGKKHGFRDSGSRPTVPTGQGTSRDGLCLCKPAGRSLPVDVGSQYLVNHCGGHVDSLYRSQSPLSGSSTEEPFRPANRPCERGGRPSGPYHGCAWVTSSGAKEKLERMEDMQSYVCGICGYVYDPAAGDPDNGVAAGTPWDKVPDDWVCPVCGADKDNFSPE